MMPLCWKNLTSPLRHTNWTDRTGRRMPAPIPIFQADAEKMKDDRLIVLLGIGILFFLIYCIKHVLVSFPVQPSHLRLKWVPPELVIAEASSTGAAGDRTSESIIPADKTFFFFAPLPINEANQQLLQTISGIGPHLAEEIIRIRSDQGPFRSPEDLLKIPGVGAKRMQRFSEQFSYR